MTGMGRRLTKPRAAQRSRLRQRAQGIRVILSVDNLPVSAAAGAVLDAAPSSPAPATAKYETKSSRSVALGPVRSTPRLPPCPPRHLFHPNRQPARLLDGPPGPCVGLLAAFAPSEGRRRLEHDGVLVHPHAGDGVGQEQVDVGNEAQGPVRAGAGQKTTWPVSDGDWGRASTMSYRCRSAGCRVERASGRP
jgi:hypothetical protein